MVRKNKKLAREISVINVGILKMKLCVHPDYNLKCNILKSAYFIGNRQ